MTGTSQPFSLSPTGTLSRRHLAQFVSAIDTTVKRAAIVLPPLRRLSVSGAHRTGRKHLFGGTVFGGAKEVLAAIGPRSDRFGTLGLARGIKPGDGAAAGIPEQHGKRCTQS
jgi:hypothetical protein